MPGLSSSERQTLEKGLDNLTRAVGFHNQGARPRLVLHHYCQGLNLLLPLLASPGCTGQFRDVLRQKCSLFLNKARHIERLLRNKTRVLATNHAECGVKAQALPVDQCHSIHGTNGGVVNIHENRAQDSDGNGAVHEHHRQKCGDVNNAIHDHCRQACDDVNNGILEHHGQVYDDVNAIGHEHREQTCEDEISDTGVSDDVRIYPAQSHFGGENGVAEGANTQENLIPVCNDISTNNNNDVKTHGIPLQPHTNFEITETGHAETFTKPTDIPHAAASSNAVTQYADLSSKNTDLTTAGGNVKESTATIKITDPHTLKTPIQKTTQPIDCEVATVEVNNSDSNEELDSEADEAVLREVEETEALAREMFGEGETGCEQEKTAEKEERSRRHTAQRVVAAVLWSASNQGSHHTWVSAAGVGLAELELSVRERLILPLTFPKIFSARSILLSPNLLLYGHNGNGILPLLTHMHSTWASYRLHIVSGHHLLQAVSTRTVHERDLMKELSSRVAASAPCALCVTDFEVLGQTLQYEGTGILETARRLKTELMVFMESLARQRDVVIFVGVTSRPWLIDPPMRRRFSHRIHCPNPSPEERLNVFMAALEGVPHTLNHTELRRIATKTSLFSRRDMIALAEGAQAMLKLRVSQARYFKPVYRKSSSANDRLRSVFMSRLPQHECPSNAVDDSDIEDSDKETESEETDRSRSNQGSETLCQDTWQSCQKNVSPCKGSNQYTQYGEIEPKIPIEDAETLSSDVKNPSQNAETYTQYPESPMQYAENHTKCTENATHNADTPMREANNHYQEIQIPMEGAQLHRHDAEKHNRRAENINECAENHGEETMLFPNTGESRTDNSRQAQSEKNDFSGVSAAHCLIPQQDKQEDTEETYSNDDNNGRCRDGDAKRDQSDNTASHTTKPCTRLPISGGAAAAENSIMYTPCESDDNDAIRMTLCDVPPDCLQEPELTYHDVVRALRCVQGELDEDDVRRLNGWHEEFGSV